MENTTTLNQSELAVLMACKNEIVNCSGCEFGVTTRVKPDGLTSNQIKGYLSQLQKKEMISIWHFAKNEDQDDTVQLTLLGCNFLLSIANNESDIEQINDIKNNL